MCNEQQKPQQPKKETQYDYRFLDYRLDQLENQISKGLEKLEKEQNNNYKELINTLQLMQESNNKQNTKLAEISQKQATMEEKLNCIDKLKEVATKNTTRLTDLERRMDIYKQILFLVGGTAVAALIGAILELIIK